MPIGSGTVSASAINTELTRSASATISIDTAENGGYVAINQCSPSRPSSDNPASYSEWRNYNHGFACCNAPSISAGNVGSNSIGVNISYSNCSTMHFEYSSNYGSSWTTNSGGCTSFWTQSGLASSTTYLIRVRITCSSTGNYSGYSNTISMTTSGSFPPYGTYLSQYCSGCTLYYRYADGSGGSYDVSQGCSTACGGCCCAPAAGTFLNAGCSGCAYYYYYADGCYGSYENLINPDAPECGCGGGGGGGCYDCYCSAGGRVRWTGCDGLQYLGRCNYSGEYMGCLDPNQYYDGVYHDSIPCSNGEFEQAM
jgi:hypothetical protein